MKKGQAPHLVKQGLEPLSLLLIAQSVNGSKLSMRSPQQLQFLRILCHCCICACQPI